MDGEGTWDPHRQPFDQTQSPNPITGISSSDLDPEWPQEQAQGYGTIGDPRSSSLGENLKITGQSHAHFGVSVIQEGTFLHDECYPAGPDLQAEALAVWIAGIVSSAGGVVTSANLGSSLSAEHAGLYRTIKVSHGSPSRS